MFYFIRSHKKQNPRTGLSSLNTNFVRKNLQCFHLMCGDFVCVTFGGVCVCVCACARAGVRGCAVVGCSRGSGLT